MLGAKGPWSQPHLSSEVLVMEGEWHKPYFYKQTIDILKESEGERQIIWVGVSLVAPSGTQWHVQQSEGHYRAVYTRASSASFPHYWLPWTEPLDPSIFK